MTAQAACRSGYGSERKTPIQRLQFLQRRGWRLIASDHAPHSAGFGRVTGRAARRPAAEPLIQTIARLAGGHRRQSARPPARWLTECRRAAADFHYSVRLAGLGQREVQQDGLDRSTKRARAADSEPASTSSDRKEPRLIFAHPDSFAAGRENRYRHRGREDRLDQIRDTVDNVLAVLEHRRPRTALQRGRHRWATLFPGCSMMLSTTAAASGTAPDQRPRPARKTTPRREIRRPESPRPPVPARSANPTDPGQRH